MKTSMMVGVAALLVVMFGSWGWAAPVPAPPGGSQDTQTVVQAREYYTCPMHASVRSDTPGKCPDCGMTLVKKGSPAKGVAADSAKGFCSCPMHSSARLDSAGRCPRCGMAMTKKEATSKKSSSTVKPASAIYTCPMHDSVRSKTAGRCPECGMTLVKKSAP